MRRRESRSLAIRLVSHPPLPIIGGRSWWLISRRSTPCRTTSILTPLRSCERLSATLPGSSPGTTSVVRDASRSRSSKTLTRGRAAAKARPAPRGSTGWDRARPRRVLRSRTLPDHSQRRSGGGRPCSARDNTREASIRLISHLPPAGSGASGLSWRQGPHPGPTALLTRDGLANQALTGPLEKDEEHPSCRRAVVRRATTPPARRCASHGSLPLCGDPTACQRPIRAHETPARGEQRDSRATMSLPPNAEVRDTAGGVTTAIAGRAAAWPFTKISSRLDESRNTGDADLRLLLLAVAEVVPDDDVRLRDGRKGCASRATRGCRAKRERSPRAASLWMLAQEPDVDPARVPEVTGAPIRRDRRRDRN